MSLIDGLYVWKTRSTPSPCEILRTVNEELSPRLLRAITTPSYACTRSRSPSTTLTCTTTVSPGLKSGIWRVMRCFSISWIILLISVTSMFGPGRACGQELIQCAPRLGRELRVRQHVGPALRGAGPRLREPPAADVGVVTGQQHRRHVPAFKHIRPRVVRPVEQAVRKRILIARALIAQRAGQQPRQRVDDHERRQLPTREHVVAHRQLAINAELDHALVHTLVPSGQQQHTRQRRQLARLRLAKGSTLRRQVHPRAPRRQPRVRRANRRQQRLGFHHHARSAPVGTIIDGAMRVGRVQARIFGPHAHQPASDGAPHNAKLEGSRDHARKQRDNLDLHGAFYSSSAGQSTTIVRATRSTLRRWRGTASTQCSRPPGACVTITAPCGMSTKWLTVPSSAPSRLRTLKPTRSARQYSRPPVGAGARRSASTTAPVSAAASSRSATPSRWATSPSAWARASVTRRVRRSPLLSLKPPSRYSSSRCGGSVSDRT